MALALGLQQRGHTVKIAAPHRFMDFAGKYGVPMVPLAGEPEHISRQFSEVGRNAIRLVRTIRDYVNSIAVEVSRGAFGACADADLIVHSFLFTTGGHSLARARGIPDISIQTFPVFAPTGAYPPAALAWLPAGWLSYFGHWLNTQIFWYVGNSGYVRLRKAHPDVFPFSLFWPFDECPARRRTPLLFAVSPEVLPPVPEWAGRADLTGYLFLEEPENFQPPVHLMRFLEAGPAPVCVTFGSMIHHASSRIAGSVVEGLRLAGRRAVILTGWDGWRSRAAGSDVLYLDSAPHAWLLPRCRAVIHHGGAGTTGAGLRAGIPNIVVPFAGDQPFWGKRVHAIGAGPRPIPVQGLNAARLASAIARSEEAALRMRAQAIGGRIRSEDGVGTAVRRIENL